MIDAGATDLGRPYLVTEYISGVPITDDCNAHHLTSKERLELSIPICQAVQHAHQKGIIHRDLKPSNVLITVRDGRPMPKIIDFGVAKAMDQKLAEQTVFTAPGKVVGTMAYMNPEQAEPSQHDIDTRSDIYSLGVMMYELLTGATPFDRQRCRVAAWAEMLRMLREEEPPKPSTRLSHVNELPANAATACQLKRQTDNVCVGLTAGVNNSTGKTVVTLNFSDAGTDFGSLADGRYTLTIFAVQAVGPGGALDGNCDGIPGDNYQLIGTPVNGLFRLFGDADGNGSVSASDFNAFRLVYGTSGPSIFDFDNDGQVSAADFNQFRLRYGATI